MFATAAEAVLDRLASDPDVATVLPGGIYERGLKRAGPFATPEAYAPDPPHQVRPAAVVVDDGEGADPLGVRDAFLGFVSVWFYAPCTAQGRFAVAMAVEWARRLLVGYGWSTGNGTAAMAEGLGIRLGVRDDPVDEQRVVDRVRFPVVAVWRLD